MIYITSSHSSRRRFHSLLFLALPTFNTLLSPEFLPTPPITPRQRLMLSATPTTSHFFNNSKRICIQSYQLYLHIKSHSPTQLPQHQYFPPTAHSKIRI
ncbi:hypothetical protein BDZ45DRAFT_389880 [Acephala macrosclerotiorum]|nr:hypothetical protein BDZ45DRAFT_389880 [Acephala macrosclerotiorum]